MKENSNRKAGEKMDKSKWGLREYRVLANMTQRELGEKVGVTGQAIGHYESGQRKPTLETAKKIADVFNVSIEEIFKL